MRFARTILIFFLISNITACESNPRDESDETIRDAAPGEPGTLESPSTVRAWPFRPTAMRVHPLSRFAVDQETGERVYELRLEFLDRFENTTKAIGEVRIRLQTKGGSEPIAQWQLDLFDLEVNQSHYDTITRTYLFKLRIASLTGAIENKQLEVQATLNRADNQQLQTLYTIPESKKR